MPLNDCTHNIDPFKLAREGCSQAQRRAPALAPDYAPVDQREPAHRMIFARAYAAYLRFFDDQNAPAGDWVDFFSSDVSVQLAVAAVQDIDQYKLAQKAAFDFLDNLDNESDEEGLRLRLGRLFGAAATLAAQLDRLARDLPADLPLRAMLVNLIGKQLAPALKSLLLYHRDGLPPVALPPGPYLTEAPPTVEILGAALALPQALHAADRPLSADWISDDNATSWAQYLDNLADPALYPPTGVYGVGATLFERVNHIATHNLFTSIFDRLLKVYARVVAAAGAALQASFTDSDAHEPHYGLFLAFLRLYERVRAETNTLTARHMDFYYREVLHLKEKGAQPGRVHLLGELARQVPAYLLAEGTLLKAGKDAGGKEALFELTRSTVLNQATVASLQTLYRHDAEKIVGSAGHDAGRLYASPVSNSADGSGAPTPPDQPSWHPFHNKLYADGALSAIAMPPASIGFALASHHLLLAEGTRDIEIAFALEGAAPAGDMAADAVCLLSIADGWLEKSPAHWHAGGGLLRLTLRLDGADPAIVAWSAKIHGGRFGVALPVMQVLLRQRPQADFVYARLQDIVVRTCHVNVKVTGLKSLSVSNDFGPVDTSKPFLPFGAQPVVSSAVTIGSREMFQKKLDSATVRLTWQEPPHPYPASPLPTVSVAFLSGGQWLASGIAPVAVGAAQISLTAGLQLPVSDAPDLAPPAFYDHGARHGFMRLSLDKGFGQTAYQEAMFAFLRGSKGATNPGTPPLGPSLAAITIDYAASQTIVLDSAVEALYARRQARFFHVGPFGQAERHPLHDDGQKVTLVPRFAFQRADSGSESGAEFYIGVSGLRPPQNLALLIEVAPGTADPLSAKPDAHIAWSYLRDNEWVAFGGNEVGDGTAGLLNSGIVTISVPPDASSDNTLLAPGLHWLRLSVTRKVDAACRLLLVGAQAMEARFTDRGNDPSFAATPLPAASATKLAVPDAAVKQLSQPFSGFGGRAAEAPGEFQTRVSERLRHKDRAITLWDYEHLVLEAFPQIYKVKCLNHTQYEPGGGGSGIYRELAPGHVTVVTVPNQLSQNLRDPLRPYTSLDLLERIEGFLRQRCGCFVRLHVRNPQFEEVRLAFKLRLRDGGDESYHVKLLREEITRFLSPWAYTGGASPTFGGKIHKSVLINFVEERPYVDYVTDFQLFHDIGGVQGTVDLAEVGGSLAVSILVSAPAVKHAVVVLHPQDVAGAAEQCPCEAS